MKSLNKLFLLLSVVIISSCSSNDITEKLSEETNQIRFTASDFKYENNSRTDFVISDSGAEFQWAENDTVGIFPDLGSQVYFPMASGAGTKTAAFDGGGWALKSSSTYAAYYPFKGDIYLDKTAIPVSYVGQKQVGNNSTEHLGAYDYMAAVASTPENGNVNFNFKHIGCLVQLNIPLEDACTVTSIILRTEDKSFVTKGSLDLTSSSISINNLEYSEMFNISLEGMSFSEVNQKATVYFMMAPADLTEKKVGVQVYVSGSTLPLTYSFIGKKFAVGSAYSLTATLDNEIDIFPAEAVDLGLPSGVKWASCNVGARSPEDYGGYYAWGETEEKDCYSFDSYLYYNHVTDNWFDPQNWIYIGYNISGTKYDAAHVKWGDKWRMPTFEEIKELISNCYVKEITYNGVNGLELTGPNGKKIFLPAGGFRENYDIIDLNIKGIYYSGSVDSNNNTFGSTLSFEVEYNGYSFGGSRAAGINIRPVTD